MAGTSNGSFVWYENLTGDPAAAIAFYTETIGWKTEPFGNEGYLMWLGSQGPVGGVMNLPPHAAAMGAPPHWMGSIQVADVDATVALARKLGGTVHHGPEDIPSVGRIAVLADPQGAPVEVVALPSPMPAHDPSKEGEFCWNELMSTDSDAAFRFYSQLFGWQTLEEMNMGPMGTYRIFGMGDTRMGGMMTIPKGTPMPSMWFYYVSTKDIEAAVARATSRGAKVINGPMDIPGGGRIAQLTDPLGAVFALHQAPPARAA